MCGPAIRGSRVWLRGAATGDGGLRAGGTCAGGDPGDPQQRTAREPLLGAAGMAAAGAAAAGALRDSQRTAAVRATGLQHALSLVRQSEQWTTQRGTTAPTPRTAIDSLRMRWC